MKTLDEIMYHVAGHGVIEALADTLREHLDMKKIYQILEEGTCQQ